MTNVVSMAGVPVTEFEGRPRLYSGAVAEQAIQNSIASFADWWAERGLMIKPAEGEKLIDARLKDARLQLRMSELTESVLNSDDPYRQARLLETKFGWSADTELVLLLRSLKSYQKSIWRDAVESWVMTNGVRFDAKEGEQVTFRDSRNRAMVGTVKEVIGQFACGLVACRATVWSDPVLIEVNAEQLRGVMDKDENVRDAQMVRPFVGFNIPEPTTACA